MKIYSDIHARRIASFEGLGGLESDTFGIRRSALAGTAWLTGEGSPAGTGAAIFYCCREHGASVGEVSCPA